VKPRNRIVEFGELLRRIKKKNSVLEGLRVRGLSYSHWTFL
jgi:hypothetical protein